MLRNSYICRAGLDVNYMKVILVTGASSGIGYETAERLSRLGHRVYGAARRVEMIEPLRGSGVVPMYLDLTDEESIDACVDGIVSAEGRIDAVVNNAGYGYFGAVETVAMEEARRQLEVNLFGLAALTKKVLPLMRRQGGGRIINVGSIAGHITIAFGAWYNVSKFAVRAFNDVLRLEAKPYGIDVSLIEPGGIGTDWGIIAAKHLRDSSQGTVYEADAGKEAKFLHWAYSGKYLSRPSVVAKAILRAVDSRRPKAHYRVGLGAHSLPFLYRILPSRWWDAILRRILF